ncbi:MAG: hypothetical protein GWO08_00430, partial [Gammaproteobacteria bacterium]|nr:hypothetical protein [Gammaproteobacteria bacterium]NIT51321.1 hypothetical protein [candidate division Zixibacteria bacterium]NIW48151.1 hypothetical protein [Gammaproteobacteria bacterium]
RGNRKSFEKAFAGIVKTLSLSGRKPGISVFCTITEWNIGHLAQFAEIFRHIPLQHLGFMHTNFTPQYVADAHNQLYGNLYPATDSSMEGISIESMNLNQLLEDIRQIKKMGLSFPVSFSPELDTRASLEIFYRQPEKLIGKTCNNAFQTIMVKSDGSVIPAHGRCYNITAGNMYQQSLKEIWNSTVLARFRKTLMEAGGLLPACSRCCSAF